MRTEGRRKSVPHLILSPQPSILLAVRVAAVLYVGGAVTAQAAEPIQESWRRPLPAAQCLAISPDGTRVAVVNWAGTVLCLSRGRKLWQRVIPGAQEVALGAGGRTLVYTPLDAMRRDLLVLDDGGRTIARWTIGGPITAVVLSPDGRVAAIGTAGGTVETHRLDRRAPVHHFAVPGTVQQLCFDSAGGLVAATADPSWLVVFTPGGRVLWHQQATAGQEFRLATPPRIPGDARGAAGGSDHPGSSGVLLIVALVPADRPEVGTPGLAGGGERSERPSAVRDRIELQALDAAGRPVWRQALQGRDPFLSVMEGSGSVVVAYERADRRGAVLRYDRSLACFSRDGSRRWERGGMVYNPLLISVSPEGDAVLSLSAGKRFWLLSGHGQTRWSYTPAAPVRIARASADGSAVAVATTDGQLALLKVNRNSAARRHAAEVAEADARR